MNVLSEICAIVRDDHRRSTVSERSEDKVIDDWSGRSIESVGGLVEE